MVSRLPDPHGRSVYFPVLLHGAFDARARCGEVLRIHGRPHVRLAWNARNQGSAMAGNCDDSLIIEEYVPGSLAVVFGKVAASA